MSCTVTFQETEEEQLPTILGAYAGHVKSTSLLGYVDGGYKQMPKETISIEKYREMRAAIHGEPQALFTQLNNNKDEDELTLIDLTDCASGACPIR